MGLKDKVLGFIAPEEDDDDETEEVVETVEPRNVSRYEEKHNNNIKSQVAADTKMVLFEPRTFEAPAMQETPVQFWGPEDSLEKE